MSEMLTDYTKDGKCSECGQCCSDFLPISKKEIKEIKKYMKKHSIKEQRHNFVSGTDVTCPFRNEKERKCEIYPVRPQICKSFVCNHKIQDIQRAKRFFNDKYELAFMRKVFFNSSTDEDAFMRVLTGGIKRC